MQTRLLGCLFLITLANKEEIKMIIYLNASGSRECHSDLGGHYSSGQGKTVILKELINHFPVY